MRDIAQAWIDGGKMVWAACTPAHAPRADAVTAAQSAGSEVQDLPVVGVISRCITVSRRQLKCSIGCYIIDSISREVAFPIPECRRILLHRGDARQRLQQQNHSQFPELLLMEAHMYRVTKGLHQKG